MKNTLIRVSLLSLLFTIGRTEAFSQVPQGFNYQAIARDESGEIIQGKPIPVQITILDKKGNKIYVEEHSSVTSNQYGLITLVIGTGTQTGGSAASFSAIDWDASTYSINTAVQYPGPSWTDMGTSLLWSVPYSHVAKNLEGPLKNLNIQGATTSMDEALFAIKNKAGDTVFAVYNEGIRGYVGDGSKSGAKGGFAIGGYDGTKGIQEYLRVTGDSTRVYTNNNPKTKAQKGGFAIGGYDGTKGITGNFLNLTKENYLIGHESGVHINGGLYNSFLGYQAGYSTTSGYKNYFIGYRAGYSNTTGYSNTFIGDSAGFKNSTGYWNTFIGDWTGYVNTSGYKNIFIGHRAGVSNISGICNVFIGPDAGSANTTAWYNTFVGIGAGLQTTTGGYNSYFGINSGNSMTSGVNNSFYGSNSGYWFDGGSGNTFIGSEAGRGGPDNDPADPPGNYNTFVGSFSGVVLENANNNTVIGSYAGHDLRTGVNNVFLGYQAGYSETGSNKLYIANSSSTPPLIYGDFSSSQLGINTTSLSKTLNVGGDASFTGNITAGSVNGAINSKIFFSNASGTIASISSGNYYLYWDNSIRTLVLHNTTGSWLWFMSQIMVLGTGSFSYEATGFTSATRNICTFNNNGDACVISFGDDTGTGYCTVWLQWVGSKIFGHYIKY